MTHARMYFWAAFLSGFAAIAMFATYLIYPLNMNLVLSLSWAAMAVLQLYLFKQES